MYGPPGTGKTLLARAVAHHTDCTFIRVSGAELVQKYIGEGSRMVRACEGGVGRVRCPALHQRTSLTAHSGAPPQVRELFVMAREAAPTIIFMDEIDSIGSTRTEKGGGGGGGDSEVQRTMLELLNQLDGFEPTQNIKVSAAAAQWRAEQSASSEPRGTP